MKVLVKKNLIIFRRPWEWEEISSRLVKDHGPSIAISWKMKRELGFTVRRHKGLVKWSDSLYDDDDGGQPADFVVDPDLENRYHYEDQVHLDFYNEAALTYFVLKYL